MPIKFDPKNPGGPKNQDGISAQANPSTTSPQAGGASTTDAYSANALPMKPGSPGFRMAFANAKPQPRPKKLTGTEIYDALSEIAKDLNVTDAHGIRADEAVMILRGAFAHIINGFVPERALEGNGPTKGLVISSLRKAYGEVRPGRALDRNSTQIKHLVDPLYEFVHRADVAYTRGLTGTKAPKPSKRLDGARGEAAARAIASHAVFEEIGIIRSRLEEVATGGTDALFAEAEEIAILLGSLGETSDEIEKFLSTEAEIAEAVRYAGRLEEIRDLMGYHLAAATSEIDAERVDYYTGFVRNDMDIWIQANATAFDDKLRIVLSNYIGLWLAEQAGDTPPGLRYSGTALRYAIAGAGEEIDNPETHAEFGSLARRMMHLLIRRESVRSRLTSAAQSRGETATSVPIARHIASRQEFASVIGENLFADFNEFFAGIQSGEIGGEAELNVTIARAAAFYELFVHYVRYAANVYGDHFGPELMRENGLEPQLVRAIYSRVENAHAYGEAPIELMRLFFSEHVTDKEIPSLEQLMPIGGVSYMARAEIAAAGGTNFVDYGGGETDDYGMTMNEFLQEMPFPIGPDFRAEFEASVGYSFDAFRRWGSTRKRSAKKTQEEWDAEVEEAKRSGHLEDVTQEPRTQAALDAILPAFWFLNEQASRHGMAIDIWDFMAAIYPVARRMHAAATDGVITLTVPSFMRDLPFRNWGYPTFAQQIIQHGLATEVIESTLGNHARGEVEQPEYWDVRRYTVPLAEGSGGGMDQQRELYEFAAGLMRFAPVLDSAAQVFDSGGGLVTFASQGMASRYYVQIEDDASLYLSGRSGPQPGAQRALFLDVRRGRYDKLLNLVRNYLMQIRDLPVSVELAWADGTDASWQELWHGYLSLRGGHDYYRALLADRSATSSTRSAQDLQAISDFYTELRRQAEEILFLLRARGFIQSGAGPVAFETSVRISGHEFDSEKFGRTTLFLDNAFGASEHHELGSTRRDDLIRLKVYLGRAIAEGDATRDDATNVDAIVRATGEYWMGSDESLRETANDLATLEKEQEKSTVDENVSAVHGTTNMIPGATLREPALPHRRLAASWADQWREFARAQGMEHEDVELAVGVMLSYFNTVRGFYSRFWPGALGAIVDEKAESLKPGRREAIHDTIVEFFPSVGVAAGQNIEVRRLGDGDEVEGLLAQWAAEDYVEMFPQGPGRDTQVPIYDELLRDFVNLYCLEYSSRHPQPSIVMAQTRLILEEYNRGREPSVISIADRSADLPTESLLPQRLAAFAKDRKLGEGDVATIRRAYYSLYDDVRSTGPIERQNVEVAIAAVGGDANLTDALIAFIEIQRADLAAWRTLVTDPSLGFPAFVRENFHAAYITDEGLAAFANEYVGDRLTLMLPTNPVGISAAIIGDAFSPHREIGEKMARFYRILFDMWIERTGTRFGDTLGFMRMSVEEMAENIEPAKSVEELIREAALDAAKTLKIPEFDPIWVDRNFQIITQLTGAETRDTIESMAADYFEEVGKRAEERRTQYAEAARAARAELDEITQIATAALQASASIYMEWREPTDISRLMIMGLNDLITEAEHADGEVTEWQERLGSYGDFTGRMRSILGDFGAIYRLDETAQERRIESIESTISEARTNFDGSKTLIDGFWNAAVERREELQAIEDAKELSADATRAKNTAETTVAALETATTKLAALEERVEKLKGEARTLIGSLNDFSGGVATTFEEVIEGQARLDARVDDLVAKIEDVTNDIRHLLGEEVEGHSGELDGILTLPAALQVLEGSIDNIGDDGLEEQMAAYDKTAAAEGPARDAIAQAARTAGSIDSSLKAITKAITDAEKRIPIGEARGIPETKPFDEEESEYGLGNERSKAELHKKAMSALGWLYGGRVLIVGDGSHLISANEQLLVEDWISKGRSKHLVISDVFGNRIELPPAQYGLMLAKISELSKISKLPEGHPFRAILDTLRLALTKNGPEAIVLYRLTMGRHLDLLRELMAYLGHSEAPADADGALTSLDRWLIGNAGRLREKLGKASHAAFKTRDAVGKVNYASDNVSADYTEYTAKEHKKRARRFTTILGHPELGRLHVGYTSPKEGAVETDKVYYVDVEKMRTLQKKLGIIETFNVDREKYESMDLSDIKSTTATRPKLEVKPISEQPQRVFHMRLLERIYSDPKLMALGWLVANIDNLQPGLKTFINMTLSPIATTPHGTKEPLSLLRAQDAAVTAYIDSTFTENSAPELAMVRDDFIQLMLKGFTNPDNALLNNLRPEFREKFIEKAQRLMEMEKLDVDANVRRLLAILSLISAKISERMATGETGDDIQTLAELNWNLLLIALGVNELPRNEMVKALEDLDAMYRDLRPKIIADSALMQRSTGMHAPHQMTGYVDLDSKLLATNTETAYVGASQLINLRATLLEKRVNVDADSHKFGKILVQLMDNFPEFANALAIIGLVFKSLPKAARNELTSILEDYRACTRVRNEIKLGSFRERIRDVYRENTEVIRTAMSNQYVQEMSLWHYLTGMERPWIDLNSWDDFSAKEKLFALAPEFTRVNEKKVDAFLEDFTEDISKGTEKKSSLAVGRGLVEFAKQNPTLKCLLAMVPALIDHLPNSLSRTVEGFFDFSSGAWKDPTAAARLVGRDGEEVQPAKALVTLIVSNIRDVRRALSRPTPALENVSTRPTPALENVSTIRYFTGTERPWEPQKRASGSAEEADMNLLPIMDRAVIHNMDLVKLEKHIGGRLAKLGLLPIGKKKLANETFLTRERQQARIDAGKSGIPNADTASEALMKILLTLEKVDAKLGREGLPLMGAAIDAVTRVTPPTQSVILREAYRFLIANRGDIATASMTIKAISINGEVIENGAIKNGKKGNGGGGSNGGSTPPLMPGGGSSAPQTPPATPTSNAKPAAPVAYTNFGGIVEESGTVLYDSHVADPSVPFVEDHQATSAAIYMEGTAINLMTIEAMTTQAAQVAMTF